MSVLTSRAGRSVSNGKFSIARITRDIHASEQGGVTDFFVTCVEFSTRIWWWPWCCWRLAAVLPASSVLRAFVSKELGKLHQENEHCYYQDIYCGYWHMYCWLTELSMIIEASRGCRFFTFFWNNRGLSRIQAAAFDPFWRPPKVKYGTDSRPFLHALYADFLRKSLSRNSGVRLRIGGSLDSRKWVFS